MRVFVLLAAVGSLTVLCLAGPGLAQNEVKDLERMQGVWKIESAAGHGDSAPPDVLTRLTFTIKGNQLIPSDYPHDFLTFKLDPAKEPFAIDLTGKDLNKGIYKIDDNTLSLCFIEGGERPTEFSSTKGNGAIYLVLKRDTK